MAKHLSVLRRFSVSTVPYDGGIELEHNWRECDWTVWVDGTSLPDIMRQATAHAKACDGKPQPKPAPREPSPSNGFVPALWVESIKSALGHSLVTPGAVTGG